MKKIYIVFSFLVVFSINSAQAAEKWTLLPSEYVKPEPTKTTTTKKEKTKTTTKTTSDDDMAGKFQFGTRIAVRNLDNDSGQKGGYQGDGTYLGTIYAVEGVQDYLPNKLYGKYFFSKYIAAELAYDSIKADTVATTTGYSTDKSDGEISAYGPTISLVGHYPTNTPFTPYASFGVGFYFGDFEESDHWGLGYSHPDQYAAYGSTGVALNGRTREIEIDNAIGILLGVGCTYNLTENWLLDLSVQYTKLEVDGVFTAYSYGVQDSTYQEGSFPLDNYAFRFGVAYQF